MQKLKQHHHVVPRSHLRGWADEEDHVAVLDRGASDARRLSVSNSAVRKRFYNFRDTTDAETDAVENWLAEHIESPVGPVLKSLRAGASIGDVDQQTVVNFTVAQLVRTPTVFAYMDQIDGHLGPKLLLMEAAKQANINLMDVSHDSRERLLEVARQRWYERPDRGARTSRLRTMTRKLGEYATTVASWHWTVLTALEPVLVSGDSPVVTLNPSGSGWAGLLPEGSPLWMPISPTKLLVADPIKPLTTDLLTTDLVLKSELSAYVDNHLAEQADRALFNEPGLSWPPELVFSAQKPALPTPTTTWRRSKGPPTFPAAFPPVVSDAVKDLLQVLGAADNVA